MIRSRYILIIGVLIATGACLYALAAGGIKRNGGDSMNIALPEPVRDGTMSVEKAIAVRRSVRHYAPCTLTLPVIAQLLWSAQGITDSGGLRAAPSAGATFPLELFVAAGNVTGLAPGVYRYIPAKHALQSIQKGDAREKISAAAFGQSSIREAPASIIIAAVYERTRARYGIRTERYVHIEVGHASQNIYLQAGALGLGTVNIGAFNDEELRRAAGIPAGENPLCVMPVGKLPE